MKRLSIALVACLGVACLALAACGKSDTRMKDLVDKQVEAQEAQAGAQAQANLEAGRDFLQANAQRPGVKVLASGVQYAVVKAGQGASPRLGDLVTVHYEGALLNGEVFDSSYQRGTPAQMDLAGLVPGWMEVLPMMRVGDEWLIWLPPEQGYGPEGAGPIPPNSVLAFRIELLDVASRG